MKEIRKQYYNSAEYSGEKDLILFEEWDSEVWGKNPPIYKYRQLVISSLYPFFPEEISEEEILSILEEEGLYKKTFFPGEYYFEWVYERPARMGKRGEEPDYGEYSLIRWETRRGYLLIEHCGSEESAREVLSQYFHEKFKEEILLNEEKRAAEMAAFKKEQERLLYEKSKDSEETALKAAEELERLGYKWELETTPMDSRYPEVFLYEVYFYLPREGKVVREEYEAYTYFGKKVKPYSDVLQEEERKKKEKEEKEEKYKLIETLRSQRKPIPKSLR